MTETISREVVTNPKSKDAEEQKLAPPGKLEEPVAAHQIQVGGRDHLHSRRFQSSAPGERSAKIVSPFAAGPADAVFRADEYNALILKRIIGLPGETISIHRGGEIFIDGKHLEEPYATIGHTTYNGAKLLEPHQYFLFGDNRGISERYFKFDNEILGKVVF